MDRTEITPATLALTPATTDFGTVSVGNSAAQVYTLTNIGFAIAGTPTFMMTGPDASQFSFVMSTCTTPLASGASCTFQVRFAPTTTGAKLGTAGVTSTPGGSVMASLSGTAIP